MPVHRLATTALAAVVTLALVGCEPIETTSRSKGSSSSKTKTSSNSGKSSTKSRASVKITASDQVCWAGKVSGQTKKGCGSATLQVRNSKGSYWVQLEKTKGDGKLTVVLIVDGDNVDSGSITSTWGAVSISYANR